MVSFLHARGGGGGGMGEIVGGDRINGGRRLWCCAPEIGIEDELPPLKERPDHAGPENVCKDGNTRRAVNVSS